MPTRPIVPSSNSRPMSVTPCGTRRGGENFGSGFAGSGAQSLRASDTSTKPARNVSDGWPVKLRDGEHLVAQRRHEQQVHLVEDARHLAGDLAAQPVGLHEVDGGEEARLRGTCSATRPAPAPSSASTPFAERQLLERRRGFGEQDRHQRAVRPVGQRHFASASCPASSRVSSAARSTSVAGLSFIQLREVADAQALRPARRRRSRDGSARSTTSPAIGAGDRLQHEHRVLDAARHRARACRATSRASSRRCAARGRTSDADR